MTTIRLTDGEQLQQSFIEMELLAHTKKTENMCCWNSHLLSNVVQQRKEGGWG